MTKLGRNDLCSCGSGIKYKKCCAKNEAATNVTDLSWQILRQTEGRLVDYHLTPYVTKTLPNCVLRAAIEDLMPGELPDSVDDAHFFSQFTIPWVLFNWVSELDDFGIEHFDENLSIAMNYLRAYKNQLNTTEKRFIETMNTTYYSFYSILEVVFEKNLLVKDILLGTTHTIKERQGTHHLKKGDIVFSRILTLDNQSIFVGMAPIIIPVRLQTSLIDFREWLVQENDDMPLTPGALRAELDLDILDYFFDTIEYLSNPNPTLVNTDGDLIVFSESYFELNIDVEEALHCLLPLTLLKNPEQILESAKRNKSGKIIELDFPWLKKGNKKHPEWENTILGHIRINKKKLVLETNSEKRTQKGKKLLTKYLSDNIRFQKTLLESPEQKMKSLPEPNMEDTSISPYDIPEIQEQLKLMAKQHWDAWFDNPIPALNNKTPRQAAKTADGRERLEALLLHYERNDGQINEHPHYFKADINLIKSELNLE